MNVRALTMLKLRAKLKRTSLCSLRVHIHWHSPAVKTGQKCENRDHFMVKFFFSVLANKGRHSTMFKLIYLRIGRPDFHASKTMLKLTAPSFQMVAKWSLFSSTVTNSMFMYNQWVIPLEGAEKHCTIPSELQSAVHNGLKSSHLLLIYIVLSSTMCVQ